MNTEKGRSSCAFRGRRRGFDAAAGAIAAGGKDVATFGGVRFRAGTVATGGFATDSEDGEAVVGNGCRRWTFGSKAPKTVLLLRLLRLFLRRHSSHCRSSLGPDQKRCSGLFFLQCEQYRSIGSMTCGVR